MKPGLYQRRDGSVLKFRENNSWQYLSPLFGEWLDMFRPLDSDIAPYPRNLNVHEQVLDGISLCPSGRRFLQALLQPSLPVPRMTGEQFKQLLERLDTIGHWTWKMAVLITFIVCLVIAAVTLAISGIWRFAINAP